MAERYMGIHGDIRGLDLKPEIRAYSRGILGV